MDKQLGFLPGQGKKAGLQLGKSIADGVRASEADVKRAFDAHAKLADRAADATGKLRTAEAQLQQLRKQGANDARLTAGEEKVAKFRRDEIRLVNDAKSAYSDLEKVRASQSGGGASFLTKFLTEDNARSIGTKVGKTLGLAIAGAAGTGIAGIGYTLTKGFERLQTIDQATFKLKALGHSADETKQIMDNATASVKGTSFSLADAATAAASAVAAGIKPGQDLTKYLGEIGDAAAVAGTNFEDMGSIFNKIQTQNKAYTDDLQQLSDRGLPISTWLQQEYGVTADKLSDMVQKGQVDSAHFQEAIDKNIGGAALKMGESFDGAVEKMEASIARLGANFITALLGGDQGGDALAGPTQAIGNLTTKLDGIGQWVQAHSPEIHAFFEDIKTVAMEAGGAVHDISTWLVDNKTAAEILAGVFVGWKVLSTVNDVVGGLKSMSNLLRTTLPGDAAAGATAMEGSIGGIVSAMGPLLAIPGFLAYANSMLKDAPASPDNARARGVKGLANSWRDPAAIDGGGGANSQRERRGLGPIDPTYGLLPTDATGGTPIDPNDLPPWLRPHFAGGYTGNLPIDRIAGVVHGDEFVVKATSRGRIENAYPGLLDFMNNTGKLPLPGYAGGGQVGPDVAAAENLVGTPYSMAKRFDCSGDVARVISAALGREGGGLMTTANAAQWLSALGFQPGIGGPGTISVGWKNGGPGGGHMAMTLSDGRNAEGGGSHPNFMIGGSAAGASSAQFTNHMFLRVASSQTSGEGDQDKTPADSAAPPSASGEGASASSSGVSLPSSISGLATSPFDAMTAAGQANSGPGHRDPAAYFPNAVSHAIGGQITSALGVAGINDTPAWLSGISDFIGQVKVGGHTGGPSDGSLFDGSNLFGSFGQGRSSSAMPLAATSTGSGTPPPDGDEHGLRAGQAPGPVFNTTISAFDTTDALRMWDNKRNQIVASKIDRF